MILGDSGKQTSKLNKVDRPKKKILKRKLGDTRFLLGNVSLNIFRSSLGRAVLVYPHHCLVLRLISTNEKSISYHMMFLVL